MKDKSSLTRVTHKFFWWCRECGWWTEVDFSGLCSDCRGEPDPRRGASPEEMRRLAQCDRCL